MTPNFQSEDRAPVEFYLASDAAKRLGCSPRTVKTIVCDLKLEVARTVQRVLLLTEPQLKVLKAELDRRRRQYGHRFTWRKQCVPES